MRNPVKKMLAGWGMFPQVECAAYRPERLPQLAEIASGHASSLLAYGNGRSYGDAALNPDGTVIMNRLDRFIAFDTTHGVITAEAGLLLSDMLKVTLPQGWICPVIPGSKQVTLGGMLAANVHGKNHYREGCIAGHVQSFHLRLADGQLLECSPQQNAELFHTTLGGMGLTGIIEVVTLQLKRIESLSLKAETKRVANLTEMLTAFEESKDSHEYRIGWIDHHASGKALGQGVFSKANHIGTAVGGKPLSSYQPPRAGCAVPLMAPSWLLNKKLMRLYNAWRFGKYKQGWKEEIQSFEPFFHPLDGIAHWNRLYGKAGFLQHQSIIPESLDTLLQLRELLETIQAQGEFSFLAVLKHHRDEPGGISFPIRGYSLALDFPNTHKTRTLLGLLNQKVASWGGRVYLAKDATLTAGLFEQMYQPALGEWQKQVRQADPDGKWNSVMAIRLAMRGGNR